MPQTLYEIIWIFFIYAFLGWCTEVAYAALDIGKFVNRGFLNGPCCPVYGFGVLIVVGILTPLKDNLLILFTGSVLLTTVLEYITGWILEKAFHNKWWDYSDKPFNVKGYICLKFSILWGLACTFIMVALHPAIFGFIKMIPKTLGIVLSSLILGVFVVDCIVTVSTILKFNKRLRIMGEIADKLKDISNEIGENIYENVSEAIERKELMETRRQKLHETVQQNLEKKKAEYELLNNRYKELLETKIYGHDRLLKAFPGMKSADYDESLLKLKEHLKKFKNYKK